MRAFTIQLVIAASFVAIDPARAEPAHDAVDEQTVAADRLFEEGRTLAKEHRYAEACARFALSDALKHTFGTLVNLGDCARQSGQLGLAWQRYDDAARAAERDGADNACGHFDIEHPETGTPMDGATLPDGGDLLDGSPIDGSLIDAALPEPMMFYHGHAATTTEGSISVPLARTTIPGNVLILTCADTRAQLSTKAVTSDGVDWKRAIADAFDSNMEIWYGVVTAPSNTAVRIDSAPPTSVDFTMRMSLSEWSGLETDPDNIFDDIGKGHGERIPDSTAVASTEQITAESARDVIVLGVSANSPEGSPASFADPTDGPWTTIGEVGIAPGTAEKSWYRIVPKGTVTNPTVTVTTSSGGTVWSAAIVAFQVAH